MLARVVLDDFFHQAVDGAASGGHKVQCPGAIKIRFQCALNGLDLSGDAFYALEKIVFVCCDMAHWMDTPPTYALRMIGIPPIPMQGRPKPGRGP
ncbi:hypothetical protein D3C87_2029790 [compost metagenome]